MGTGLLLAACSGPASQTANSGGGGSEHRALGVPAAAPRARQGAAAPGFSGASGKFSGRTAGLTLSSQSIIHTAFLTDRVKDVTAAATTDTNLVTAVGGYVSSEQETVPPGRHGVPQISLGLKIPAAQYFPVLAKLRSVPGGKEVSFSQRATDVTQQVADVGSRVASAQAAISQLRALLKRAGSVGALLSVQDEINSQEASLEALLAQQRSLAHETSFGTVTVTLVGHHARIVPHKKHEKSSPGFAAGLRGGWHALVLVVGWALTALGSLLPFLIPAALIAAIAFEVRRRLWRRKSPPAAEPPAPVTP